MNKNKLAGFAIDFFAVVPGVTFLMVVVFLNPEKMNPDFIFLIIPVPFIWLVAAFLYLKKNGWNWKLWWMILLLPIMVAMFFFVCLVIGGSLWNGDKVGFGLALAFLVMIILGWFYLVLDKNNLV